MENYILVALICLFSLFTCDTGYQSLRENPSSPSKTENPHTIKQKPLIFQKKEKKVWKQIEKDILEYYTVYMNLNDIDSLRRFRRNILTTDMYDKYLKMVDETGADPIINAQDVSEWAIKTLSCKHVKKEWYVVSYQPQPNTSPILIMLKASKDSLGTTRISNIKPN